MGVAKKGRGRRNQNCRQGQIGSQWSKVTFPVEKSLLASKTNGSSCPDNSSPTILNIFDMQGREVITLVDEELPAGEHEINFNAKELPSGMYFYSLKTQNFSQMKKFIIVK